MTLLPVDLIVMRVIENNCKRSTGVHIIDVTDRSEHVRSKGQDIHVWCFIRDASYPTQNSRSDSHYTSGNLPI